MLDARVGKDEQTTAHGAIVHICVMWTCLLTRHGDSRLMQPHKAMRVLQLAICCCFAVPDGKAQLWLGWVSQALSLGRALLLYDRRGDQWNVFTAPGMVTRDDVVFSAAREVTMRQEEETKG
jgi:hypothetical protein